MKNEDIEGIIIEDASESNQTSKIVNKLGYKKIDDFQFIKYRDDFINNKIK